MISDRSEVTRMILAAKVSKGLKWADVAEKVGLSKEWVTAGCLGQMTFSKAQAEVVGGLFDLSDEAEPAIVCLLIVVRREACADLVENTAEIVG